MHAQPSLRVFRKLVGTLAFVLAVWPSGLRAQSVLHLDGNPMTDHALDALNGLGVTLTVVTNDTDLLAALASGPWDVVTTDVPSGIGTLFGDIAVANALVDHVNGGGALLFSWWDLDGSFNPPFAAAMRPLLGVESTIDFFTPMPVFAWDPGHPIFNDPVSVPSPIPTSGTAWNDNGDRLTPSAGALAIGGFVADETPGQAAIVVANAGRTIVNGFVADNFEPMAIQALWQNEVTFLLNGGTTGDFFVRGDTNDDGLLDVSDAVYTLAALFIPGAPPSSCADAADVNDDGLADVSDAVYLLASLFIPGAPPPPEPSPTCGVDLTPDALECDKATGCP